MNLLLSYKYLDVAWTPLFMTRGIIALKYQVRMCIKGVPIDQKSESWNFTLTTCSFLLDEPPEHHMTMSHTPLNQIAKPK